MKSPQSLASSIVGLALAVLLAGWALQQFAAVVMAVWPVLAGVALTGFVGFATWSFFRRSDRW